MFGTFLGIGFAKGSSACFYVAGLIYIWGILQGIAILVKAFKKAKSERPEFEVVPKKEDKNPTKAT